MSEADWRVGEVLVQKGIISWDELEMALSTQGQKMDYLKRRRNSVWCLGEILVRQKRVSWDQLKEALRIQRETDKLVLIGRIFVEKGIATQLNIFQALAFQFGLKFIGLDGVKISRDVVNLVPKWFAYQHTLIPLVAKDGYLLVAISDPLDVNPEHELQKILKDYQIRAALACPDDIRVSIHRYYGPLV